MKLALLQELLARRAAKDPVCLLTDLDSGEQRLVPADAEGLAPQERAAAQQALRNDRCVLLQHDARRVFVHPYPAPLRMILVGAVHIAQDLARMAPLAGYQVVVVDPRRSWAHEGRFAGVELRVQQPQEAIEALAPDRRTSIVVLSHDPKIDDPALETALRHEPFYVGALGSRKTHIARLERLRRRGVAETALARIHAPVGLPIGSTSPAEVAISILAQMTERLRKGPPVRRVAALVLAAGRSRRMGPANKLLADVGGVPMIVRVVDTLQRSRVACVYVVTGFEGERVRAALAGSGVRFVPNPDHDQGLSTSLRAGLGALPEDVEGALVALGDMPWVRPEHVDALLESFDPDAGASICVPVAAGTPGNPVLWARRYWPEMQSLTGDVGARALLQVHARQIRHVEVGDPAIHIDVDTADALSQRPDPDDGTAGRAAATT